MAASVTDLFMNGGGTAEHSSVRAEPNVLTGQRCFVASSRAEPAISSLPQRRSRTCISTRSIGSVAIARVAAMRKIPRAAPAAGRGTGLGQRSGQPQQRERRESQPPLAAPTGHPRLPPPRRLRVGECDP